jgi:hypothetical protein
VPGGATLVADGEDLGATEQVGDVVVELAVVEVALVQKGEEWLVVHRDIASARVSYRSGVRVVA